MTTPAVNNSISLSEDGQNFNYNPATGNITWIGTGWHSNVSGYTEKRPESVNNKKGSSGWRKPSNWSHTYTRYQRCQMMAGAEHVSGSTVAGTNGNWSQMSPTTKDVLPITKAMEDAAINAALLKLSDQKASLSENFAEREQGARLMGNRLKQIAKTVMDFKRGKPRLWSRVKGSVRGRGIPDAWLEVQYGWNPLLSDIKGVYDLMRDKDKDANTFRTTVKAGRTEKDVLLWDSASQRYIAVVMQSTRVSGVFVRLDYALDQAALHQLQQVDVTNPFLIAWNLMPYSFVIDWALPVGNYLQASTADLGYRFLGGSISKWQTIDSKGVGLKSMSPYYPTIRVYGGTPASAYYRKMSMSRRVLTSSPAARLPHFKNPLSFTHFANAMSLLVSAFR